MKFMHLLRVLRAHGALILCTLTVAWLAAALATVWSEPRYVATSSVLVDSADDRIGAVSSVSTLPHSNYLATQIDLIASQSVALKVVDRLNLEHSEQARRRLLGTTTPAQARFARLKSAARSMLGRIGLASDEVGTDGAQSERYILADRLLEKISVRPSPDSNVIEIAFAAPSAQDAATGANAVVDSYIETALELNVTPARASSAWLDSQVERLAADAERARAALTVFQQRSGIVAGDGDDEVVRLNDLNSQLVAAQSNNHPAILALKSDLARAQAKLNDLPPQLGPNHPDFRGAQEEVAALQLRLAEETAQLTGALRREIGSQKASMLSRKRQHAQLDALRDTVDNAQRALDEATQRAMQARMNSDVKQVNVSVIRIAVPPLRPTTPNPPFNFALATFVGGALGVGLALWREVVCRFVRGADDLRDLLGIQVLGVLHGGSRAASGRTRLSSRAAPLLTTGYR